VREQQVVRRGDGLADVLDARRVAARPVAEPGEHHGSFSVIQRSTESPNARATMSTYSPKRSTESRAHHPPSSSIGWGRSQW